MVAGAARRGKHANEQHATVSTTPLHTRACASTSACTHDVLFGTDDFAHTWPHTPLELLLYVRRDEQRPGRTMPTDLDGTLPTPHEHAPTRLHARLQTHPRPAPARAHHVWVCVHPRTRTDRSACVRAHSLTEARAHVHTRARAHPPLYSEASSASHSSHIIPAYLHHTCALGVRCCVVCSVVRALLARVPGYLGSICSQRFAVFPCVSRAKNVASCSSATDMYLMLRHVSVCARVAVCDATVAVRCIDEDRFDEVRYDKTNNSPISVPVVPHDRCRTPNGAGIAHAPPIEQQNFKAGQRTIRTRPPYCGRRHVGTTNNRRGMLTRQPASEREARVCDLEVTDLSYLKAEPKPRLLFFLSFTMLVPFF